MDRDGDGRIDDISELFGSDTAVDGFIKLAELDQNGDGLIDAGDAHFADLRVWTDQDQDGFSDAAELKSLQELGVAALSLDAQAVRQTIEGNSVSDRVIHSKRRHGGDGCRRLVRKRSER